MASYKLVDADQLDADLKTVADSIRAKTGKTEQLNFPNEFKSAIEGIGATAQRKNGTFTTNSSGTATVNCGFKPDVVLITGNKSSNLVQNVAAVFAEDSRSTTHESCMAAPSGSDFQLYQLQITQSSSGFSVKAICEYYYDEAQNAENKTFNYVAVKYTE